MQMKPSQGRSFEMKVLSYLPFFYHSGRLVFIQSREILLESRHFFITLLFTNLKGYNDLFLSGSTSAVINARTGFTEYVLESHLLKLKISSITLARGALSLRLKRTSSR